MKMTWKKCSGWCQDSVLPLHTLYGSKNIHIRLWEWMRHLWRGSSTIGCKYILRTKIVWRQIQLINVAFQSCVSLCYTSWLFCCNLVVRPATAYLTPFTFWDCHSKTVWHIIMNKCLLSVPSLLKETTVLSCLY